MPSLPPIAPPLLEWFATNARVLPFRQNPTPYGVWVSEIMLQQTRVAAALEHYNRFMAELPTVAHLAACDDEKLFKLWEGLGYYSRARNLKKAAVQICQQHGGQLPADYEALLALPGIGEYTAGAIGSIAFGLPVPAVDGNVLRVFSRLYNDKNNITEPKTKRLFTQRVRHHQPAAAAGAYNEALMELGALICLPNGTPLCSQCPLQAICLARKAGRQAELPVKTKPKARRIAPMTVLLIKSEQGWLLQKRPAKGLLAGLWQPVLLEGHFAKEEAVTQLEKMGLPVRIEAALPPSKHIFSHIEWQMQAFQGQWLGTSPPAGYRFVLPEQIAADYALPGAFKAYKPLLCE